MAMSAMQLRQQRWRGHDGGRRARASGMCEEIIHWIGVVIVIGSTPNRSRLCVTE